MKISAYKTYTICAIFMMLMSGCEKNESRYIPDAETPGVAVFSNTGNNLFTCLLNGEAWQTIPRVYKTGFGSYTDYEVNFLRDTANPLQTILQINWAGSYADNQNPGGGRISLNLAVAKNFQFTDISAMQGKRFVIDGVNSYFTNSVIMASGGNTNGSGNIYFNVASVDSIGLNQYTGRISGILDADFGTYKITSGRFDDNIETAQLRTY